MPSQKHTINAQSFEVRISIHYNVCQGLKMALLFLKLPIIFTFFAELAHFLLSVKYCPQFMRFMLTLCSML